MRKNILHNTEVFCPSLILLTWQLTYLSLLIFAAGLVLLVKPLQFCELQGGVEYERHCPDSPEDGANLQ